jgi:hypothetical protein
VLCALIVLGGISSSVVADCWRARGLRRIALDTLSRPVNGSAAWSGRLSSSCWA